MGARCTVHGRKKGCGAHGYAMLTGVKAYDRKVTCRVRHNSIEHVISLLPPIIYYTN